MRSMSKQTLDFKCGWFWPHCNTYFTSLKKHWNVAAFPHFLWRSQLKFLVLRPTDLQIGDTQGQFHRLLKPRATGYRAFMFKPTTMYVRQYKYYIILYMYSTHRFVWKWVPLNPPFHGSFSEFKLPFWGVPPFADRIGDSLVNLQKWPPQTTLTHSSKARKRWLKSNR